MNMNGQRHQAFPGPAVPSPASSPQGDAAGYVFKIAGSGRELIQAFHLLYEEYRRAGYVAESPHRLLFTRYHLLPETTVFLAKSGDEALSTATAVRDSRPFGLPMDDVFGEELDRLRQSRRSILEVSSLASNRRKFSRQGITDFISLVYAHSLFQDVDDICIMVNPKHVRLYMALFGFEIFGTQRHYARVNAPAVALRVDVREARMKFGERTPLCSRPAGLATLYASRGIDICARLRDTFEGCACGTAPSNPLDAILASRILAGRAAEMRALTPQCRDMIARLYPGVRADDVDAEDVRTGWAESTPLEEGGRLL